MILACNTESLLTVNHEEAALILQQATGSVRLLVGNPKEETQAREKGAAAASAESPEHGPVNDFDVELTKEAGKGLGLSLVGRRDGPGVFVSDMVSRG